MRAAIVIPVYNHGRQVGEVIRQTLTLGLPVFVVDDGSTDSTREIIGNISGLTTLYHTENQGKGAALVTGFTAALQENCNYAITIDADGQHKAEDAAALLQAVQDDRRALVVGNRQGMAGENVPWTSRFGRGFSNFWVRASGGPKVMDSQSGFRLYPLPEAMQLEVRARRYQFEVEILVKARQQGMDVIEVPVQVVYQPKTLRVSHFRPWLDFMRNSNTFSRLIFSRLIRGLFRL